jgi:ureidoacrylate peracid hydrolase
MHRIEMPSWATAVALDRRGKAHIYDNLDPRKTALIVVDLQNGFMDEEVAIAYVPTAVEIVPNVNRLAAAVRRTGGKVFWIKMTFDATTIASWSQYFDMLTPAKRARAIANMAPNARGHELYPTLEVKSQDEIVDKHRFSAFVQGSSDLTERLRAQGCDTVLIAGTVTNVCCESSARDAMMLNFKTIMVSDGNAARTDAEHNATLASFYSVFGDVMDTDFVIRCLEANAQRRPAAA